MKRAAARDALNKQAEKMRKNAGGRQCTMKGLTVGTVVTIALQKVDRGRTDYPRIPGVVIGITNHRMYRIGVAGCRLKTAYPRSALLVENLKTAACYRGFQDVLSVEWHTLK